MSDWVAGARALSSFVKTPADRLGHTHYTSTHTLEKSIPVVVDLV